MLKEALDEMLHGERTGLELSGVRGAVLKGDLRGLQAATMIDGEQTPVSECDAVDVGGQILERGLSVTHWFAMHDPFSPPDFWRDLCIESCFSQSALEGSPEQLGESFYRQEKVFTCGQPPLSIVAHPTARNQVMHMRMVEQVAGPGMQHADHSNLAAHKSWISGQFLGCLGRSAEEQAVDQLLILAGDLA